MMKPYTRAHDIEHAELRDYFYWPTAPSHWPRVLVCLIAALVFAVAFGSFAFAADWALVVKPIAKQVPRLEMLEDGKASPGICSGIVLNIDPGILLTAAHCIPSGDKKTYSITANGRDADVLKVNRLLDLAVVKFHRKQEEAMVLATDTPPIGTEIAVAGFGFGIQKLAIQFGRVSQSHNDETKTLWVNVDTLQGDSGGPLVNEQGQLVGMTSVIYSNGPAHISGAIPVEVIHDFVEPWLPKKGKS
jgi:S1-C subfamily serine protease